MLQLTTVFLYLPVLLFAAAVTYGLLFVLYRLTFHPLAQYPGPFLARVSGLYAAYHALIGDRHLETHRLHQRYGDIVRVGPNILSINKKEAIKDIYGVNQNVKKGFLYQVVTSHAGYPTTFSTTDRELHAKKRRVMGQAFTEASLRGMEEYVLPHVRLFLEKIAPLDDEGSSKVDVGLWSNYLTFDVMGDISFGRDFGMLEKDNLRDIPDLINGAIHRSLIAGSSRLLFHTGLDKVFASKAAAAGPKFFQYVQSTMKERINSKSERRDVIGVLLEAKATGKGPSYELPELMGEARSLMIGGSDTTATQLAANFFYISQNEMTSKRLNSEIRSKFNSVEEIRLGPVLESCQYLKAVVEETLRVNASIPGYLPREVLPGGVWVAGTYFPTGVELAVPTYTIHHDPRYFDKPHEHMPSRWLPEESGEDKVNEARGAFIPFSYGSRVCIGRRLAYIEMWIAVARVVFLYDMKYVSGGRETCFGPDICEYKVEDTFSAKRDGPIIEFRKRQE